MLSYRHAFHAGNHADVLKHAVLIQLLHYLNQKDTPYMVIDTHAGAGLYELEGTYARKSGESGSGIARLWERKDLPPALAEYIEQVKSVNPDGRMRFYPGSPWCADQAMRPADRLRLFELHPTDHKILQQNFRSIASQAPARGKRVLIERADGFQGLKGLLPPPSRRGLILIDPPYEVKNDYRLVIDTMRDALQRFATGVYAVWYPILQRIESRQLPGKLKRLGTHRWLHATLAVGAPAPDGFGLRASGMFIVNPPWTLEHALRETLPFLKTVLAQDAAAAYTLESGEGP